MRFLGRRELVQIFNAPLARMFSESRANRVFRPLYVSVAEITDQWRDFNRHGGSKLEEKMADYISLMNGIMLLTGMSLRVKMLSFFS